MDKWLALAQAFENVGRALANDCKHTGGRCDEDGEFDELYAAYASLLEVAKSARRVITERFDEIDQQSA